MSRAKNAMNVSDENERFEFGCGLRGGWDAKKLSASLLPWASATGVGGFHLLVPGGLPVCSQLSGVSPFLCTRLAQKLILHAQVFVKIASTARVQVVSGGRIHPSQNQD